MSDVQSTNHSSAHGAAIDRWIAERRDEFLNTIKSLIEIPTENIPPHGDELAGQRYLLGLMQGYGALTDLFELSEVEGLKAHSAFWPGRDYTNRPNLVGRFPGRGGGRSLLFSSHMDTASREPLPWLESEPFSGEVKGDRIYGRGTYDMKAALLSSLFAARAVRELGIPVRGDVLIESVVDEEWGGSNGTIAARLRGHAADAVVLPEPSHMLICPAHLGVRIYRLTISGAAGMRFGGESFGNPVVGMAQVVQAFQEFAAKRQSGPLPTIYEGGNHPPVDIMGIHAAGYGVPKECTLDFCVHCFEGETSDSLDRAVQAWCAALAAQPGLGGAELSVVSTSRFVEPSSIPADHPIVSCAARAMKDVPGRTAIVRGAPFACDGYVFNNYAFSGAAGGADGARMPAIILGPGGARAHANDEYADVEDLVDLVRVYARMILDWCG